MPKQTRDVIVTAMQGLSDLLEQFDKATEAVAQHDRIRAGLGSLEAEHSAAVKQRDKDRAQHEAEQAKYKAEADEWAKVLATKEAEVKAAIARRDAAEVEAKAAMDLHARTLTSMSTIRSRLAGATMVGA